MEKDLVELGTCCLAFAKQISCWSFLGVTFNTIWSSSYEGGNETSLLEFEKSFMIEVVFFMTSLLATLTPAFVLLGFVSSFFYFCVWDFFVATSISFDMFLIAWSNVSKLKVPSLCPCWRMWSIALIGIIGFTIGSMVVFSSTNAFHHGILPCIISFRGETPTWWGYDGTDGMQSYLIPRFIFET